MKRSVQNFKSEPISNGIGSNPPFRAETALDEKSGVRDGQNQSGRATNEFKPGLRGLQTKPTPSKKASAQSAAKEAKQRLIAELRNAWAKAPSLAEILNRHSQKIVIRVPGAATFKLFNYKEGIERVLALSKRLKIGNVEKNFPDRAPSRAERRKILKEARRLAKARGKR